MKKSILLFVASLGILFTSLQAQPVLYGLTELGGNSAGTISKYEAATNTLSAVYAYPNEGYSPALQGAPIQASNGRIYAMTNRGGRFGYGTIFTIDASGANYRKIHEFDSVNNGADPRGALLQASNGLLYGLTLSGGNTGQGVLFSFDPVSENFTKLHDFLNDATTKEGERPFGNLIEYNSKLYGMLSGGGDNSIGTIFSVNLDGTGFTKLHDFINAGAVLEGARPFGSLFKASDNIFYGMTNQGGASTPTSPRNEGYGIIFSFDPSTNTFTKRFDFTSTLATSGRSPYGSFMEGTNGLLYGLTYGGGAFSHGTICSFNRTTNAHAIVHNFRNITNFLFGRSPSGSLIQEAVSGRLFGLTSSGGTIGVGTLFSIAPDGTGFTVNHNFAIPDGSTPFGTLCQLSNGDIWGLANYGGVGGGGTVYSVSSVGTGFNKRHDFSLLLGQFPKGGLIEAKNQKLYGMTYEGGANGQGTIFSFNPPDASFSFLHSFQNSTTNRSGSNPTGSLVEMPDGKLFGMTFIGGTNSQGTIFSIETDGSGFTKRYDFATPAGSLPFGSLTLANDGLLYGLSSEGGGLQRDSGVIFSFNPATNAYNTLYAFNTTDGASPRGSLVQASNGLLYGMTRDGGSNGQGVLFSFNTATSAYIALYHFGDGGANLNGARPHGNLTEDANGTLYGMTSAGGANNLGTIFSFNPNTGVFTTLKSFTNTGGTLEGQNPFGSLSLASDGKLYGMTRTGGANNLGTLFSLNPAGAVFTKLQDFNFTNGASPLFSDLVEPGRCRPPVVVCPGNISVATTGSACTAPVSFSASLTDFCPATITYYVNYGTPEQASIVSGYAFPIGTQTVTAVAKDIRNYQSTCSFTVTVTSGSTEICGNNVDDDCDGLIDETCAPKIHIDDATVTEISGQASVKVYLTGISEKVVKVNFETKNQSAKSPADYTAVAGQLTFNPGETVKYINIVIKQDNLNEKTEHFEVRLANPQNATFESGSNKKADVYILNSPPGTLNTTGANRTLDLGDQAPGLQVRILPNPSRNHFSLSISSNGQGNIQLRVTDIQGRIVESRVVEGSFQQVQLGDRWSHGNYILEIRQGAERKVLQLVKLK